MESISQVDELDYDEEAGDEEMPLDVPADRRRVLTQTKDVPIETIHNWIARGRVILQPEFQRNYVWDGKKASRLIESLLLDIPIPVVYLAEEQDGKLDVVDGQQRLTSIDAFLKGVFPDGRSFALSGLQVLSELNGRTFRDLPENQQDKVRESNLRLITILKDSDPDVKFEVFERLNLGAVKLTDQEVRNCVYRGNYNQLLADLSRTPDLLRIRGEEQPHNRMADRQLILRFFAMRRSTHLKYKGPMKSFLNREMDAHRNLAESELREMRASFEKAIHLTWEVFGEDACRRFVVDEQNREGRWERRKLNVALWDTVVYSFDYYSASQIIPIADAVREELIDLMVSDGTFENYITRTTDKPERVRYRADEWLLRLRKVVDPQGIEPRAFSRQLKERLWRTSPTCGICGQRIQAVDGAEIDHIIHYWRGGRTIPENARLTHRFCNRSRGGRD